MEIPTIDLPEIIELPTAIELPEIIELPISIFASLTSKLVMPGIKEDIE